MRKSELRRIVILEENDVLEKRDVRIEVLLIMCFLFGIRWERELEEAFYAYWIRLT